MERGFTNFFEKLMLIINELKKMITNFSIKKICLFPFRDKEKACIFAPTNLIPRRRNKKQEQNEQQETLSFVGGQETLRRMRWYRRIFRFGSHDYPTVVGCDDAFHGCFPWRIGLHYLRHHCSAAGATAGAVINPLRSVDFQRNVLVLIQRERL